MRRSASILPLILSLLLVGVEPAGAWSNGVNGPNSFGTHDWVLRTAIRRVGAPADWVCVERALRATDDPDTVDGIDHASGTWWHVYDRWGSAYGDAPEAVGVWFARAERRLASGDRCAASRALGLVAHFVADVSQPMHTDGALAAEDRVHAEYEGTVDRRCTAAHCRYRPRYDGRDTADPRRRTIAVARAAHRDYTALVRRYEAGGYTRRVDRITRRALARASNAVADLLWTLSRGR